MEDVSFLKKPNPKTYGFEEPCPAMGEEGGWLIEGGEEAYCRALDNFNFTNSGMSVSEQINQFVAENGGNERDALNVALAQNKAFRELLDLTRQEITAIDIPDEALGCGVEDNGIRDRYQAARYGFNVALEKAVECLPVFIIYFFIS